MMNLRKSKILFLFFLLFLSYACSVSTFHVAKQDKNRTELNVTPDRILLECAKLSQENDYFMFLIYILDEQNTVISTAQGNNLDKESCYERIEEIGKILEKGKEIYIAGMGDLNEPRKKEPYSYTFPKKGTYNSNGRTLQFMAIANEKGQCYSAYHGSDKPCPRDPFPIK